MAFTSVTYTFSNGSSSDATQVNQNFTDITNGLSDGTKSLNVDAVTAGGTATFNAGVSLGYSSSNDLTVNASLASDIAIKTNSTYNFGSTSKGLLSIYLGGGSTRYLRLKAGTLSNSYSLTLPPDVGVLGQTFTTTSQGQLSFRYPDKAVATQTSTYAATGDETLIPVDASSAGFTVTLPDVATYPYKRYVIQRVDQTLANALTISSSGSDTLTESATGLSSVKLMTLGEAVELINDGTSIWYVRRRIPGGWTAYTPTYANLGTPTTALVKWRRVGGTIVINASFTAGTVGSGTASISLPSGLTIDTTYVPVTNNRMFLGTGSELVGTAAIFSANSAIHVFADTGASTSVFYLANAFGSGSYVPLTGSAIGTSTNLVFECAIPIANWAG